MIALERRLRGQSEQASDRPVDDVLRAGELVFHRQRYLVLKDDKPLALTPMEYRVLLYLAEHANTVCGPDNIVHQLYGPGTSRVSATEMVKTYVKRLRCKIESNTARPTQLVTVRGFG